MLEASLSHKFHKVYLYKIAMQFLPTGKKKIVLEMEANKTYWSYGQ